MEYIIAVAVIIFAKLQTTQTRDCYVCGIGADEPFSSFNEKQENPIVISSCDEFQQSSNLEKYIVKCPANYMGCITQTDGNDVIRTCDILPINDCKTANGVKYCYCNTNLCNKKEEIIHKHNRFLLDGNNDDEDLLEESSGLSDLNTNDWSLTRTTNILYTTNIPTTNIDRSNTSFARTSNITLVIFMFILIFL